MPDSDFMLNLFQYRHLLPSLTALRHQVLVEGRSLHSLTLGRDEKSVVCIVTAQNTQQQNRAPRCAVRNKTLKVERFRLLKVTSQHNDWQNFKPLTARKAYSTARQRVYNLQLETGASSHSTSLN